MSLFNWIEHKTKRFRWWDIALLKVSVFVFTLMLVAFAPKLASLAWYWYALIFVLAAFPLIFRLFKE